MRFPKAASQFLKACSSLANTAFQTDLKKLLSFDRKFHRQVLHDVTDKTVHKQRHGRLFVQAALAGIEELII